MQGDANIDGKNSAAYGKKLYRKRFPVQEAFRR